MYNNRRRKYLEELFRTEGYLFVDCSSFEDCLDNESSVHLSLVSEQNYTTAANDEEVPKVKNIATYDEDFMCDVKTSNDVAKDSTVLNSNCNEEKQAIFYYENSPDFGFSCFETNEVGSIPFSTNLVRRRSPVK